MITGASQAEAALLIVDAKEGVKEQTKRHAYILSMLGLEQVVVIINKMDLVNYERKIFDKIKKIMNEFLSSIGIKANYYIPISAIKGNNVAKKSKNMSWYEGPTVLESLDYLKNKLVPEDKALIFPIQDVYKINDKRILVGRIEAGTISEGEQIKILPYSRQTKVKSIEKFLEDVNIARAGESIGITTADSLFVDRGNIICKLGQEPQLTNSFKANIFWMSKKSFDKSDRFTLKCATQEIGCGIERIYKRLDSSTLEVIEEDAINLSNLEVGEVLIKTKKPVVVTAFNEIQELGRFVLVEAGNTCAGGIITKV
jgi:sulfate adenylyltransferase subunit 1 (EFTu-like GTPase family)